MSGKRRQSNNGERESKLFLAFALLEEEFPDFPDNDPHYYDSGSDYDSHHDYDSYYDDYHDDDYYTHYPFSFTFGSDEEELRFETWLSNIGYKKWDERENGSSEKVPLTTYRQQRQYPIMEPSTVATATQTSSPY